VRSPDGFTVEVQFSKSKPTFQILKQIFLIRWYILLVLKICFPRDKFKRQNQVIMSKNLSKISKPNPFCLPFQACVCAIQEISSHSLTVGGRRTHRWCAPRRAAVNSNLATSVNATRGAASIEKWQKLLHPRAKMTCGLD
jgi:hypothetical protein